MKIINSFQLLEIMYLYKLIKAMYIQFLKCLIDSIFNVIKPNEDLFLDEK